MIRSTNRGAKRKPQRSLLCAENLERRQLMAGDYTSCQPQESFTAAPTSMAASGFVASATNTTDSSGEHFGAIDGFQSRSGTLDASNRIDLAKFSLERDADVDLFLWGMNRDANLFLFNEELDLLAQSMNRKQEVDTISTPLEAGDYTAIVISMHSDATEYQLSILARLDPVPTKAPLATLPEVPQFGGELDWNLNAIGAPEAWTAGYTGRGVTVAVVDSGIDLDHPDLVHSLYVNPGEVPGNGIDDDRNGFIDDIHGFDFVDDDAIPEDTYGHGTHVAGTIAAANNGYGSTGVAPDATIIPVRVLDGKGSGSTRDVAAGIRYAADLGADIINLSLAGGYSSSIGTAIDYARSRGVLIVAAAGNDHDSVPSYPARFSATEANVISVGAYRSNGNIAGFSNQVGASGAIQIDAPGVQIYSTYKDGRYATKSGTSMATPHVAGLAALALSSNPNLSVTALRQLLVNGANGSASHSDSAGNALAKTTVARAASSGGPLRSAAVADDRLPPRNRTEGLHSAATFGTIESRRAADPEDAPTPRGLTLKPTKRVSENANFATPSGSRNSSVDRYFEAFSNAGEGQIDTPLTLDWQDFA